MKACPTLHVLLQSRTSSMELDALGKLLFISFPFVQYILSSQLLQSNASNDSSASITEVMVLFSNRSITLSLVKYNVEPIVEGTEMKKILD